MVREAGVRWWLVLVVAAIGCGPGEADVVSAIVRGDLDKARVDAGSVGGPWKARLEALDALAAERAEAHAAEWAWTRAQLDETEAGGHRSAWLTAIAAAIALSDATGGDLAPIEARVDTVLGELSDDPAVQVEVYAALTEAWSSHPDRQAGTRRRLREASLRARYAPDALAATRSSQQGIRAPMASRVLQIVLAEHVSRPDPRVLLGAARAQLIEVAALPEVVRTWSGAAGWQPTWPEGDPGASLGSLIAAGMARGLPEELVTAEAVDGMLGALDPHTRVIWPADLAAWSAFREGVSYGIGAELDTFDGAVAVVRLVPDGPAWRAGLHVGDAVLRIGTDAGQVALAELLDAERLAVARTLLAGPPDTTVALEVRRGATALTVGATRGAIPFEVVTGVARDDNNRWTWWLDEAAGLGYARIGLFREHTDASLLAAAEALPGLRGLVLDLRGNPGGDVNAAAMVADRFVREGIVARLQGPGVQPEAPESGPDGQPLVPWNQAIPGDVFEGIEVVVLVDGGTASSAELVSGALRALGGARLVGSRTFGKGLSQGLRGEDADGFALQVTNSWWELPGGQTLHRQGDRPGGVQPDVEVRLTPFETLGVELLRDRAGALRTHADGSVADYRPPIDVGGARLPKVDPVLARGTLLLRALVAARTE